MSIPLVAVPKNRDLDSPPVLRLLERADLLEKLDAKLCMSQGDLCEIFDISTYQAAILFRGPLRECTFPVGSSHRRLYLPALLTWIEEHLGGDLSPHELE
jgi:hypothetical protein